MSTSDPSQADSATLLRSLQRDIAEAQWRLQEAFGFLREAAATAYELERRQRAKEGPAGEGGALG